MSYHRAYQLILDTDIELPELPGADGSTAAQVEIRLGEVDDDFDAPDYEQREPDDNGERYIKIQDGRVLLHVDLVARYRVEGGNRITVDPHPAASQQEIRVFLLGTCLGAALHQRGALVLHASGIGHDKGAVLFTGRSGAGKSTLLSELLRRGFRMLVDDVCAIEISEAGPIVTPSYPRTRLWADSAAHLDVSTAGLSRTRESMEKYERQLPDQFWSEPAPLRLIYHLAGPHSDGLGFTPLRPLEALPTLVANTYRRFLLDALDTRRAHFSLVSRLAAEVPVIRVTRPADGFSAVEMADRVVLDLSRLDDPC